MTASTEIAAQAVEARAGIAASCAAVVRRGSSAAAAVACRSRCEPCEEERPSKSRHRTAVRPGDGASNFAEDASGERPEFPAPDVVVR